MTGFGGLPCQTAAIAGSGGDGDGIVKTSVVTDFCDNLPVVVGAITASGCRGVFSHHKAANRMNWGKVNTTLAMIDAANDAGADIYLDVYRRYCIGY